MKVISFSVLLILSSINVSASCPKIAGNYNCTNTESNGHIETYKISILQDRNHITMKNNYGTYTIIADGVEREFENGHFITSLCNGDTITTNYDSFYIDNNDKDWQALVTSTLKKDGNLLTNQVNGIHTSGSDVFEHSNIEECIQE